MAEITLTVTGSEVGTLTSTLTMAGADSDRLLAYLSAHYGKNDDGTSRTPTETISAYWAAMAEGTIANVTRWEQSQAAKTASDAVVPIAVT